MKQLFTIVISLLLLGSATAQTKQFSCTAGEMSQKQYDKHPELLAAKAQMDSFTAEYTKRQRLMRTSGLRSSTPYVVPVVFHILHNAGYENVPDSFIYVEIHNWNQYMSMTNPELSMTVPSFTNLIGDPQVEFRLAQKDPNGNCTNGIDHIYTEATYFGDDDDKLNPWPPDQYLNVWLMKAIKQDSTDYGILAYAYYPTAVNTYSNNAIIDGILAKYFIVGGYDPQGGITHVFERSCLGHECGHWMNLEHPWGNTNSPGQACGDDDVDDTPITEGQQNIDPIATEFCTPGITENVQNIMNYSNYHFMFTLGQVDRMHAALNSSFAGRDSIWSYNNLVRTGTDQPIVYPNPNSCAAPIAEFAVSDRYICTGQNIQFTDVSFNAIYQVRQWTFPSDASITTSTDAAPIVYFNTPGWKQVTLLVSNANGSSTKTKTMVFVNSGISITAPYIETFEDTAEVSANWTVLNYDNNNTYFHWYNSGHASGGSYTLNMYESQYDGDRDELVSPMLDLTNLSNNQATLTFDYSFATWDASHVADSIASLAVLVSNDCGASWHSIYYNTGGYNLFNAGAMTTGPYYPARADEYWKHVSVSIPSNMLTTGTNFKIELLSVQQANEFYIDNINIGEAINPTGINTVVSGINSLNVAPNPASGSAAVIVDLSLAVDVTITLSDMTGREVATIYKGQMQAGTHKVAFDSDDIATGIYIVKVSNGKSFMQNRFVKI